METVRIVLVGIGGYGAVYVNELLGNERKYGYELVGAVDPYPDNSPVLAKLTERGIPIYASLEAFYAAASADLAIISSPIQFHADQTCLALSHGSHVLCEKPLSASVEEARRMIRARDQANKTVSIGYQWSYTESIQALKRDLISGVFGKPIRLKSLLLWPRSDRYYARSWAGKKRDSAGRLVLDSVANNATAHYIHNMFYVLGRSAGESARPARVTAELYRANPIENYDTAAMRAYTEDGVELLYYGSHAVKDNVRALLRYECEHAVITYNGEDGSLVATMNDGQSRVYADPEECDEDKLWAAIAAARGEGAVVCGIEAALSHTLCIEAMQQSMPDIAPFPESIVCRGALLSNGETGNYVEGLLEQMKQCYEQGVLPAEVGLPWARAGKEIVL